LRLIFSALSDVLGGLPPQGAAQAQDVAVLPLPAGPVEDRQVLHDEADEVELRRRVGRVGKEPGERFGRRCSIEANEGPDEAGGAMLET